jgi:hypothetical protein
MPRTLLLALAYAPYLACAGWDGWLHERARKVPRVEQALHAGLAVAMIAFVWAVFTRHPRVAFASLALFVVLHLSDALGYHRGIAPHERRVHGLANVALGLFVLCWLWVDRA